MCGPFNPALCPLEGMEEPTTSWPRESADMGRQASAGGEEEGNDMPYLGREVGTKSLGQESEKRRGRRGDWHGQSDIIQR